MEPVQDQNQISRSRWISIASMMSALAIIGSYALVGIPNVELGSTVLFITSYLFGYLMGIWCTLIMAVVFGSINPWGGLIPQIWITQVLGWLYITAAGGIMGKHLPHVSQKTWSRRDVGFVGGTTTLFYDLFTNLGYAWAFSIPYWAALVSGMAFMVLHVVTNSLIFAAAVPNLVEAIQIELGPLIWQTELDRPGGRSEG